MTFLTPKKAGSWNLPPLPDAQRLMERVCLKGRRGYSETFGGWHRIQIVKRLGKNKGQINSKVYLPCFLYAENLPLGGGSRLAEPMQRCLRVCVFCFAQRLLRKLFFQRSMALK